MPSGGLQNHSAVVCVCGVLSFFGSHVSGNLLLFCMAAPLVGYVMWRKMKDSTGWWNLREISKWFMSVHICILCHLSHASAAVFREGHQWWGSKIIGIYRVPLPLHHPVFLPPTHFVSLPVVWWEADRWQSHFHSGTVPCYLGAKPCNSYKCHIKSQPGRRGWQSDREAVHNCYYLCLCGWHPQIEL